MQAPATRSVAVGAIVSAHAIAIYILEHCLTPPRTAPRTETAPLIVAFVQETGSKPRQLRPPLPLPMEERKRITVDAPIVPGSEEATGAITDWEAEAHAAATDTLRRKAEAGLQREFSHRFPSPAAQDAPGVFGSERQNRRTGVVEGGEIFWVTDNCYYDFPRAAPLSHAAGQFQLITPVCKPPPTGGGADMFESLAPEYLKREPGAKLQAAPR